MVKIKRTYAGRQLIFSKEEIIKLLEIKYTTKFIKTKLDEKGFVGWE